MHTYTRLQGKSLQKYFFQGKVLILVGARQTGKTTLVRSLLEQHDPSMTSSLFYNCDRLLVRDLLHPEKVHELLNAVQGKKFLIIDEAQKVEDIGTTLKILVETLGKEIQILVTGSSTLHLLDEVQETLTGRKLVFTLFPIAVFEYLPTFDPTLAPDILSEMLLYGNYPEVLTTPDIEKKKRILEEIVESYLYRDILEFQKVRNPQVLQRLLRALALQIGSEVSYTELAQLLEIDRGSVERYIDLLEKSFVIFRLPPFFTNKRKELSRLRKIYFYDVGIRNMLINNFNSYELRDDIGKVWENFCIVERMKRSAYRGERVNRFFWRQYQTGEVDLVEEYDGALHGYEIKWQQQKKITAPLGFSQIPHTTFSVISRENIRDFFWGE